MQVDGAVLSLQVFVPSSCVFALEEEQQPRRCRGAESGDEEGSREDRKKVRRGAVSSERRRCQLEERRSS